MPKVTSRIKAHGWDLNHTAKTPQYGYRCSDHPGVKELGSLRMRQHLFHEHDMSFKEGMALLIQSQHAEHTAK